MLTTLNILTGGKFFMDDNAKKKLQEMYRLAKEFMNECPDEDDCTDAENEVVDEVANLIQTIKNAKLV